MRLDIHNTQIQWQKAVKHGTMLAKPSCLVIIDRLISQKLLLETLEGEERLGDRAVICVGPFQDAWQQTAKKMLAKYDVTDITNDGWMVCSPRPGNEALAVEITKEFYYEGQVMWHVEDMGAANDSSEDAFHVRALWGVQRGLAPHQHTVQYGTIGDWVLRSPTDPNDVWIVKEKIFKNTYKVAADV